MKTLKRKGGRKKLRELWPSHLFQICPNDNETGNEVSVYLTASEAGGNIKEINAAPGKGVS